MREIVFLLGLSAVAGPAAEKEISDLRNWSAPPYWSSTAGTEASRSEGTAEGASSRQALALASAPLPFVAITPCHLADTRDGTFPAGYGPPFLGAGLTRNFVFINRCGIPATAQAVSANLTVTNALGTGPS